MIDVPQIQRSLSTGGHGRLHRHEWLVSICVIVGSAPDRNFPHEISPSRQRATILTTRSFTYFLNLLPFSTRVSLAPSLTGAVPPVDFASPPATAYPPTTPLQMSSYRPRGLILIG